MAPVISRVELERRISNEHMHELEPHGLAPDWLWQFDSRQPIVWTMDAAGEVSRSWTWLDAVAWHDVAAIRMEWDHGVPIDIAALGDDDGEPY